ncbi:unnamed protein product [Nippostrongylus brasiliensis]|uniref:Caspase-2 n=1 Tax=Nippostrongylus brasiliensis TaxID=27835 RepID=A0A0N4Y850_NIPBR|nr:unnamed protein product [Nippostrongylus brasiliensis]
MMRNERRQQLDRSLLVLSREMDVDDVLVYLQGKGIFTDAVVDKILSAGGLGAQRTAIVRAVKCRGDRAYDAFFRALLHARQPHLADLLRPLVDEAVLQSLSIELSAHLSVYPSVSLSVNLSPYLSVCLSICLFPGLSLAGVLEDLRVDMIDGDGTPEMEMFLRNRDSEMLARVRSFANDPEHKHASSAIVVVLTHGERDQLLGVGGDDDILSVYPFLEALNARNAPFLAGKPKLIFIQACRGDLPSTAERVGLPDRLRNSTDLCVVAKQSSWKLVCSGDL